MKVPGDGTNTDQSSKPLTSRPSARGQVLAVKGTTQRVRCLIEFLLPPKARVERPLLRESRPTFHNSFLSTIPA